MGDNGVVAAGGRLTDQITFGGAGCLGSEGYGGTGKQPRSASGDQCLPQI